jgi:hypothetical protein
LRGLYVDDRLTVADIAATLRVAHGTVHQWLIAAEIQRRASPSARRGDLDNDHIRELHLDDGLSASEITAEFGCGSSMYW